MNLGDLIAYVATFFGGAGLVVLVIFLFPEKVEKWSVILWTIIYFLAKKGEKKIVAYDIQGRVNNFSKTLKKEIPNFEPAGLTIEWITDKETQEQFFKANRLVIRMRQHVDQNKNFVHASMVFISNVLLRKAKKYLSPSQRESVDLFVGRKLMEKEKPQIVDRFFEDYFSPKALTNDKIMELLEKYGMVDKVGLFFPVLVQELTFLGEKVFYKPRSERIIVEVTEFIKFLEKYAGREIGEEEIPKNFEGAYCRCGIVIIARRLKREIGDVEPFIKYIGTLLEKRLENIYLIGSASSGNRAFINQVADSAQGKFGLEKYASKAYKAKILFRGERHSVDSYLVHLRSREVLRYYDQEYQEKFVERVSS